MTDFTNDQPWVLRKLSKHDCVRADAIALHSDEVYGPFVACNAQGQCPSLGEVLMSRIS
jgi:hypothetical protein